MTDIIKVAQDEIDVFDRPSSNTSKLLILEIQKLREELDKCQNEKNELKNKYKNIFKKYKSLKTKTEN